MRKSTIYAAFAVGLGLVLWLAAARARAGAGDANAPAAPPTATQSGPAATSAAEIAPLIERLGAKQWNVRDDAQKRLIEIGWDALAALRKARDSKDMEVAARADVAIKEIERQMAARRAALRGKMDEGYFSVSKENYLKLLALPEPPLRDCYAADYVFLIKKDWPAQATALEAAGATLQRLMATPVEQFVKATDDLPPGGLHQLSQPWQTPGSHVYVKGFDGTGRLCQGTVKDWLPHLAEAQQALKRDCAGVYWELGRLYRNELKQPKDALRAFQCAAAQQPFCAEPLETLMPKCWPVFKTGGEALWPTTGRMGASQTDWHTRDALNDLADMQEKAGDIKGALDTRIRFMLAVRMEEGRWNNHHKGPQHVWSLIKQLPPASPLPPLPVADAPKTARDFLARFPSDDNWAAALAKPAAPADPPAK